MLVLALVAVFQTVVAKEKELPIDPELRIGRLENGMTYYIRHNEQPKGRAEFWLVQNTGSLVEEDDERGLAHMIEHIAFQGNPQLSWHRDGGYLAKQWRVLRWRHQCIDRL